VWFWLLERSSVRYRYLLPEKGSLSRDPQIEYVIAHHVTNIIISISMLIQLPLKFQNAAFIQQIGLVHAR
jgi:hypothetical protein